MSTSSWASARSRALRSGNGRTASLPVNIAMAGRNTRASRREKRQSGCPRVCPRREAATNLGFPCAIPSRRRTPRNGNQSLHEAIPRTRQRWRNGGDPSPYRQGQKRSTVSRLQRHQDCRGHGVLAEIARKRDRELTWLVLENFKSRFAPGKDVGLVFRLGEGFRWWAVPKKAAKLSPESVIREILNEHPNINGKRIKAL